MIKFKLKKRGDMYALDLTGLDGEEAQLKKDLLRHLTNVDPCNFHELCLPWLKALADMHNCYLEIN